MALDRSVVIADKPTLDAAKAGIDKLLVVAVPTQAGALTYNGNEQTPVWNGYDPSKMTISGDISKKDAGTYNVTFTLKAGFEWDTGGTDAKKVTWKIGKGSYELELSDYIVGLDMQTPIKQVVIKRLGDGAITVNGNAADVVTPSFSNDSNPSNILTLVLTGNGSANVTVQVAESKNYLAPEDKVITVDCSMNEVYGIRIDKNNSDPNTRVVYTDDAIGKIPARMNYAAGRFNYGDWENAFFVRKNYPCMLNQNGTVAYQLDPNDYTKKLDGTPSDVDKSSGDMKLNAMSSIPLTYVYAYEDAQYEYIKVANFKVNENYQAIAHTRRDKTTVVPEIFLSIYKGSLVTSDTNCTDCTWGSDTGAQEVMVLRSLSGHTLCQSLTAAQEVHAALQNNASNGIHPGDDTGDDVVQNNSSGQWYTRTWGQRTLINYLLLIMGKSTNTQEVFGNGVQGQTNNSSSLKKTGSMMNQKGQFWGAQDNNSQMKVFHMEDWWGNQWERIAGLISDNSTVKVSLTGPYYYNDGNSDGNYEGYVAMDGTSGNTKVTLPTTGYIRDNTVTPYGRFPKTNGGSTTTYDSDYFYLNASGLRYALVGGCCDYGAGCVGTFYLNLYTAPSHQYWNVGACLSFV